MYGGGRVGDKNRGIIGGGVGCDCTCAERTDPALDSVSNLYSKAEEISVSDNRPSSCPTYTFY